MTPAPARGPARLRCVGRSSRAVNPARLSSLPCAKYGSQVFWTVCRKNEAVLFSWVVLFGFLQQNPSAFHFCPRFVVCSSFVNPLVLRAAVQKVDPWRVCRFRFVCNPATTTNSGQLLKASVTPPTTLAKGDSISGQDANGHLDSRPNSDTTPVAHAPHHRPAFSRRRTPPATPGGTVSDLPAPMQPPAVTCSSARCQPRTQPPLTLSPSTLFFLFHTKPPACNTPHHGSTRPQWQLCLVSQMA